MKKIEVGEFKERCLDLLDNLDDNGLIVTRHGAPVARVFPYAHDDGDMITDRDGDLIAGSDGDLIGSLRNELKIKGDVFTIGCAWKANAMDEGPNNQG